MPAKLYKILVLILISTVLNKLLISCEEKNMQVKLIRGNQIVIDSSLSLKKEISLEISPYREQMQERIQEVLCYNPRTLTREEAPLESSLGNAYSDICRMLADSIFNEAMGKHVDFALFNFGGIRTSLDAGPITVEDIFRLMPFENRLVIAELDGSQIEKLLRYLERSGKANPVSGIRIRMQGEKIQEVEIGGKPFDPSGSYFVLTHDYLQHGGDNMDFFEEPLSLYPTGYRVRDALIDHMRRLDTLRASLDGRFTAEN